MGEETNKYWKKHLRKNRWGDILVTVDNIATILENDPYLKGTVRLNRFTNRMEATEGCPCDTGTSKEWSDACQSNLSRYLSDAYGLRKFSSELTSAIQSVSELNAYHPVRDYLDSLPMWDKRSRIPTLLHDYLGAVQSSYVEEITKRWMAAAVGRIYEPGMKFDSMLLLSGKQGVGKSTFFRKLAIQSEWFTDSVSSLDSKSASEDIQGRWIVELSELSAMRKSEVESTKSFLSRQSDRYRPAYGRYVQIMDRQCVFAGTTNEDSFLRDDTGNRRFWCVHVDGNAEKSVWKDLDDEVDQIWAEAKILYLEHSGDIGWFNGNDIRNEIEVQDQSFREVDPWKPIIESWLDTKLPSNWYSYPMADRHDWFDTKAPGLHGLSVGQESIIRQKVCPNEILNECLLKPRDMQTGQDVRRVNRIMKSMEGWTEIGSSDFNVYGKSRGFRRVPKTETHDQKK